MTHISHMGAGTQLLELPHPAPFPDVHQKQAGIEAEPGLQPQHPARDVAVPTWSHSSSDWPDTSPVLRLKNAVLATYLQVRILEFPSSAPGLPFEDPSTSVGLNSGF